MHGPRMQLSKGVMALPLDISALLVVLQIPTTVKVGHVGIVLVCWTSFDGTLMIYL
jgi:hypothetical protein